MNKSSHIIYVFSILSINIVTYFQAEQEAILNNRKDVDSALKWDEYKSMTFTLQVSLTAQNVISYMYFMCFLSKIMLIFEKQYI